MTSTGEESQRKRTIVATDILPEGWSRPSGQALVRAFSMVGVAQRDLSPPVRVVLGDVCVFMMWSSLPRLGIEGAFEIRPDGEIVLALDTPSDQAHPEGPVALFIAHPDISADVNEAIARTDETVAQLTTINSLLLAFEHVEDYWIRFPGKGFSPASRVVIDTTWFEAPDLSAEAQQRWRLVEKAIESFREPDRLRLSLRWLDEAKRSKGVDAFLKMWFALETLTGSSDQKAVSRINQELRSSYNVDQNGLEEFGVGRIFGLRGKIVHHGLKVQPSGPFLNFVAGLYLDLLVPLLGFQLPGRARFIRDEAGGIRNLLPAAVGGRAEQAVSEEAARLAKNANP